MEIDSELVHFSVLFCFFPFGAHDSVSNHSRVDQLTPEETLTRPLK